LQFEFLLHWQESSTWGRATKWKSALPSWRRLARPSIVPRDW